MKNFFLSTCLSFFCFCTALSQDWNTDIEVAKSKATKQQQNIVLVFQGSDWCAPCIKLDKEIWSTETFKAYAKDHFVMLQADFPRRKKNRLPKEQQNHNNRLAEAYNKNGHFPLVVVLDKNGEVLGQTGYKKLSPSEYIVLLTSFKG
ncbi:thioredoxin family protein [uncultured Aquimarina sp.]|uniref:thioredoxin family protein n=1 Tax=uncultured Aquimarina sp. TaxID=575652 RepID=UPI0026123197|nr:thioredoxin family protein [uncultured Aquimarina sp.]